MAAPRNRVGGGVGGGASSSSAPPADGGLKELREERAEEYRERLFGAAGAGLPSKVPPNYTPSMRPRAGRGRTDDALYVVGCHSTQVTRVRMRWMFPGAPVTPCGRAVTTLMLACLEVVWQSMAGICLSQY